jgi:hypothetical protein
MDAAIEARKQEKESENARQGRNHRKQQSQGETKCVAKKEAHGTRKLERTRV